MCQEKSFLFEHNREVYEQLENYLSVDNKAIIVLGTGIGKTTTALEYLNNHQVRGLVICPQNAIRADWDKVDEYVDTITYSKFAKVYQDIDYSNYGAVICDEVHHVGADKWGAGIKHIIDNDLCKVIGLTATPDRTDKIDIVNNIFSGNICQGLDMLAGIKEGIVHPFTYVGAYYDTDGLKEENENEERRKEDKEYDLLCGKLDLAINNTPSLNEIITSNMPEGDRKIIVFVSDIDSITEAKQILKPIFPNLEHRSLHSGLSKEEIEENREWFKNTSKGLLYTINMASEGIHYIGVNTLIMFRRTCSNIVFTQQMGRISTLTKYENPNAIVFDLVNNAKTVGNFKMAIKELSKEYSPREIRDILREYSTNEKSNQIIVRDYTGDIVDVLEEMKRYDDDSWTEEENRFIHNYIEEKGGKLQVGDVHELATLFDVSDTSIRSHLQFLGYKNLCQRKIEWHKLDKVIVDLTKKGYTFMKIYYEINNIASVSVHALQRRMNKLEIDYNRANTRFTTNMDNFIKEHLYVDKSVQQVANDLGKTEQSIMARANFLKIKKRKNYSDDEIKFICDNYSYNGAKYCAEKTSLPIATVYMIARKYNLVGMGCKRKVQCVETGDIFNSVKEAAIFAKTCSANIVNCCKNGNRSTGGYHWEYVEEENEKLNKTEE